MDEFIPAVFYGRYSSDKQDEASIDAQRRACMEYAQRNGYVIVKDYIDEAISGKGSKTASRKQYQAMLRDAKSGKFKVILIHKYDRVARNVGEHVNLEMRLSEHDIKLIAVAQDFGGSKEAKIMKTMMWALSEYYIDNLSEEVKKGHKENALKGLHNGGYAPFGYDVTEQEFRINETEAAYVRRMFECVRDNLGFTDLIKEMGNAGVTGKRGRPIRYPQIYEILKNEKYTGTYKYSPQEERQRSDRRSKPNAIKIENALPIIISKALFEEVQHVMEQRKHTGAKSDYLCSGLVYCGNCGAKMHGVKTKRKGHEYRRYTCSARCGIGVIDMDRIDNGVKNYLYRILSERTGKEAEKALSTYSKLEKERVLAHNEAMRTQVLEKQKKIDNYMETLGSGSLPKEVISDIGEKIVKLKREIQALQEAPIPKDYTVNQVKAWLDNLKNSTDERKTIELLVERIDATKTEAIVTTTLASVVGENGCGGSQHILPTILFRYALAV